MFKIYFSFEKAFDLQERCHISLFHWTQTVPKLNFRNVIHIQCSDCAHEALLFREENLFKQFIIFIKKKKKRKISILCSWTNLPYQLLFAKYRKIVFSTAGVLFYLKNRWLSSHNNIFPQDIHNLSSFLLNT